MNTLILTAGLLGVCFLFALLACACFVVGFRLGQDSIDHPKSGQEQKESGYTDYQEATHGYKAFIPGKQDEQD